MTSASHAAVSAAELHLQVADDVVVVEALARRLLDRALLVRIAHGPVERDAPGGDMDAQRARRDRRQRRRRVRPPSHFVMRRDRKHDQHEQRGRPAREDALGVHRGDATARHHAQTTRARAAGAAELRLRCEREAICARRDRHRREPPSRRAGRRRLLGSEPGRAGERVGAVVQAGHGSWVGWAGIRRAAPGPFDFDGIRLTPIGLTARRSRTTTRASPTPPSGRSTTTRWSRPVFHRHWRRGLPRGQPALRRGHRRGRPARAPRSGCRTTSCSWCRRCCASAGPTCGSASSCTSRSRRSSCSCSCPQREEIIRGLLGRRPGRLPDPAGRAELPPPGPPPARPAPARRCGSRSTAARCGPARSRSPSTSRRWRRSSTRRGRWPRADGDPGRAGPTRRRSSSASTGSTTPRASSTASSAYRELLAEGRLSTPETVLVQVATPSRERVEHYARLRENVEREVGRINGEFGRVGAPAVHYLHQSYSREPSWPRSTGRPT